MRANTYSCSIFRHDPFAFYADAHTFNCASALPPCDTIISWLTMALLRIGCLGAELILIWWEGHWRRYHC